MRFIKKDKLSETLTQNWTKYVDYKNLLDFIISTIKLYAKNLTRINYSQHFSGNKITVTKSDINTYGFKFDVKFEIKIENAICFGNISVLLSYDDDIKTEFIQANLFSHNI